MKIKQTDGKYHMWITQAVELNDEEMFAVQNFLEFADGISKVAVCSMNDVCEYFLQNAEWHDDGTYHISALHQVADMRSYHGRLSDVDEIVKRIVNEYGVNSVHELPQDIKAFYDKFIKSAPTVLDATREYKMKNYACVKGVRNEDSN